jgi:hypothetical protein
MGGDAYPKILKARLPDNYPKTLRKYIPKKAGKCEYNSNYPKILFEFEHDL